MPATAHVRWVATCLLVLAASGCGSGTDPVAVSASRSVAASPTVSTRPVAEVASLVAQQRARIEKLRADLEGCPTADEIAEATCSLVVQRAPAEGGITLNAFKGLMGATMPAEVSVLFNQTYSAALDLSIVDISGCEDFSLNAECSSATFIAQTKTDDLLAKFDGWGPYQ